jgi:hypothetical protein
MREQPAGWYRDTDRPNVHRYWNGQRWSDWVAEELARVRPREPEHDSYDAERACG